MPELALTAACAFFALALPLSIAGANSGWGLIAIALAFGRALGRPKPETRAGRTLLLPLFACLATGLLSAVLASPPSWAALKGDGHRIWIAILLGAAFSRLDERARRGAAAAFLLGSLAAGAIGVFQALQGRVHSGVWPRAHAFVHPVTFGELIVLGALGVAAWLAAAEGWRDLGLGTRSRAGMWAALLTMLAALVLSETRGAVLGFGAGLLSLGLAAPARRRLAVAAIPLTLAVFLASDLLGQWSNRSLLRQLFGGAGRPPSAGQTQRLELWSTAWDMFRAHPLTGVGPGNYRAEFPRFSGATIDGERAFGTAHNLFLHHLAERGAIGLAATLWLFAALWLAPLRRALRRPDALALWALSATAAFTIMNLTEVALQTEQAWLAFFFIWILSDAREKA